ncbi:UDP-glucosyltransferase 2-like [Bicyclus anynana]|uniref:UDP-glucuronosyltransferase n=1 Tax=Bicyclus anynana TaxID=110368 RepID=A0ABM3LPR8_BICAN|nr:UDP-glucosyltransferase 2-like [Bicyclus anynana]
MIGKVEPARILAVFPVASISHQVVFRPLINELAKRGHEVVVITPDPAFSKGKSPQNLTEIDIHELSYKIWNDLLETGMGQNLIEEHEEVENKVVRGLFGPSVPDLSELKKNVHLIFLNVNPIWDFNRPVPPNIIYLGGIHQNPHKELPKDIESYLDSSQKGVIYMSFGTNARTSLLPVKTLKLFTNVFSQLPYDILCKWDDEELPNRPENVRVSKWLPQSDLLKHPNVKLFITQGGLQSTDEALNAGVPLVVIPFLGDQWFNAEQYEKLNIGIHLDLETITEDSLKIAIEKTIQDKTYRENVVKLHNIMRDQPQTPLERAVWWTEYVLRHGGATHLRAAGAHMHWTEYYAMDVVIFLLVVVLTIFIAVIFAIRYICDSLKDIKIKLKRS